jgi:AcrR family transcriptional regulator
MGIQERKERERERRRQQIIVAAKRVFSEKGFNRATMEDIAQEAELSPGTLYLYFKNKDELYASLSLRILQYLNIRLDHVVKEEGLDPAERMQALKEAIYDVYQFDPLILINLFHLQSSETLKNLSPELFDDIQNLSRRSLEGITALFHSGIDGGLFESFNPAVLAEIFWSLFSGMVLWEESKRIFENENDFLKNTLDMAFGIFLRGIRRQKEVALTGYGRRVDLATDTVPSK